MIRFSITLDDKTTASLVELAKQEYRDPRQQAALIIREELMRRGLLPGGLVVPAPANPNGQLCCPFCKNSFVFTIEVPAPIDGVG